MTRTSKSDSWRKTRWQGVYQRNGRYRGQLYVGKRDGRSRYEWLPEQPTGKLAADALAAARASRTHRQHQGRRRHTVASWAARTAEHPHGLWLALRPRKKASSAVTYAEACAPFVAEYGDMPLHELDGDVELALDWIVVRGNRWTLGGLRAMCTDARKAGHLVQNPFVGLGVSTGPGRRDIDVLTEGQVLELAESAVRAWPRHGVGAVWRAVVLWQAFVGTRPAETYGLVRADVDLVAGEVSVLRQRPPFDARTLVDALPLPKNGRTRRVNVHPLALDAVRALPTPLRPDAPLFQARRGGPLSGASQHYYWHPIRVLFGQPGLDLYALRHFCGSYMLNDLRLAPQDVAAQLGHLDGGVLVQRLYGHPSEDLARERIAEAFGRAPAVELGAVTGEEAQ